MQDTDILSAMVIAEKIKQLQAIDVNKIVDDCLKDLTEFIVKLNQDQLYEKGDIDVNYPTLKEHYAPSTIKAKRRYANFKKTDFVTLRWTGDFYESFVVEIRDDDFLIRAMDPKWKFLEESRNFGNRFSNALGLTKDSKNELRAKLLPLFVKKLRDEL